MVASGSSAEAVMLYTVQGGSVPVAHEAQAFGKPYKLHPTYNLLQKKWNKALQGVTGFTEYSPIWLNGTSQAAARWAMEEIWGGVSEANFPQ